MTPFDILDRINHILVTSSGIKTFALLHGLRDDLTRDTWGDDLTDDTEETLETGIANTNRGDRSSQ